MKSHELGKILLEGEDLDITASIDVCDTTGDPGHRVFGEGLMEVMNDTGHGLVLIFEVGVFNFDWKNSKEK